MTDIKDLFNDDALKQLKELINAADICIFATNLSQRPIPARPMSTQEVDKKGNIWFMSKQSSDKNYDIQQDDNVQLFYSNKGSSEYLSVYGKAAILREREKAKEMWSPLLKTWFTEGVEDPELTIIKVTPADVYYWDTKNNKTIALLKMIAGAVTGKEMDDSVQGKINI